MKGLGTAHGGPGALETGREEKASLNEPAMIKSSAVPVLRPTSCALVETLSLIHYLFFSQPPLSAATSAGRLSCSKTGQPDVAVGTL